MTKKFLLSSALLVVLSMPLSSCCVTGQCNPGETIRWPYERVSAEDKAAEQQAKQNAAAEKEQAEQPAKKPWLSSLWFPSLKEATANASQDAPKETVEKPPEAPPEKEPEAKVAAKPVEPPAALPQENKETPPQDTPKEEPQKLAALTFPENALPPPEKETDLEKTPSYTLCRALESPQTYKDKKSDDFEMIISGTDGWLFRSGFDLKSDFEFTQETADSFTRLNKALKAKGTDLVVMVIPTRGLVGAPHLAPPYDRQFDRKKALAGYFGMLEKMRKTGMKVADMRGAETIPDFFLKRDNHWTAEGGRYAARKTADAIKSLPVYKTLHKTEFLTTQRKPGKGDDANDRFLEFIEQVCGEAPPRETLETVYVTAPKSNLSVQAALLGDASAPEIALLGTSNSTQPDPSYANFEGFLKEYISADIANEAITGGSFRGSIANYILSGKYAQTKPKVIVWELGGHYGLSQKDTFREIIPAIYGSCADESATAHFTGKALSGKVDLFTDLDAKKINSNAYYLALELSDKKLRSPRIRLTAKDGSKNVFTFKRSQRNFPKPGGMFFYELGYLGDTPLQSVALDLGNAKTDVTAKICKIPG